MDALARYVARPVAVASLGVALYQVTPYAAIPVWMLAVFWGCAAFRAWQQEHITLEQRTIRLAQRIERCASGARNVPPMRKWSSYGARATAARFVVDLGRHKPRWWQRDQLRYTDRVQIRLEGIIEEWGERGVFQFERIATGQRPEPNEYATLASELVYIASGSPSR